jgi:type III pantothenate kinase
MKHLLIDIGNSRIKYCMSKNSKLGKIHSLEYKKEKFNYVFKKILSKSDSVEKIYVSNVVTEFNPLIKQNGANLININSKLPIKINYKGNLGSDRICSVIGASKDFPKKKNILVVDLGTATTYNFFKGNSFAGGLIMPGLMTAFTSLLSKTSLPKVSLNYNKKLLASSTDKNIINGVFAQQIFTFNNIANELKKRNKDLYVVLTGGMSKTISKYLKKNSYNAIDLNLVLKGLNYLAISSK